MVNGLANNAEIDDSSNCDATVVLLKRGNPGGLRPPPGPRGCACPQGGLPTSLAAPGREQVHPGDGQTLKASGSSWTKRAGGDIRRVGRR